jgi:hypothetical protein
MRAVAQHSQQRGCRGRRQPDTRSKLTCSSTSGISSASWQACCVGGATCAKKQLELAGGGLVRAPGPTPLPQAPVTRFRRLCRLLSSGGDDDRGMMGGCVGLAADTVNI